MGSYDRKPADWEQYTNATWIPRHVIFCNSKWLGRERHSHESVADVRDCFEARRRELAGVATWPCDWLLAHVGDDGETYTYECGAPAWETNPDGTTSCTRGHEHVPAQVRARQGWDYADDEFEAARLRHLGIQAVAMNGGSI